MIKQLSLILIISLCCVLPSTAQLGFCQGSKGDPIFHEDFGQGTGTGSELSPEITNYSFVTGDPNDGKYTISDDIGNRFGSWYSFLPETTISNGRALIVNADFTAGRFYQTEISGLCENTTYEFSAFLMNVHKSNTGVCPGGDIPINVRFEIWDETDSFTIAFGDTPSIPSTSSPEWNQFALTFRSEPGQESVILKMFNNGDGGCGNDLAIDDIIFRSCGDLTTINTPGQTGNSLIVCKENSPLSLELSANADSSVYDQQFYQWQISLNGEDWGDISGANAKIYETSLIDESVFFRVKVAEDAINLSNDKCSSASEAFKIEIIPTPNAPESDGDLKVCQNESAPSLKVTVPAGELVNWYDQETGGNLLAENTDTYFPFNEGTYYAEAVKEGYDCKGSPRTAVIFELIPLPDLEDESLKICPDSGLTLDAGVSGYIYQWSNGETTQNISVFSAGSYSVEIITDEGCSTLRVFTVNRVENAEILEVISEEERVEIKAVNEGDFQYSLDGINYQNSPFFNSVDAGIYTAYIKDSANCKIDTLEFAHIVIPKMISPNNDGYNDFFELKGVQFYSRSEIQIYDRYGRLVKAGNGVGFEWDGLLNGKILPADDYWYRIIIEGFNDKTGHFSLIR